MFRTATARGKAEQADYTAVCAREDSGEARSCAQQFDPQFLQPGNTQPPLTLLGEIIFCKTSREKSSFFFWRGPELFYFIHYFPNSLDFCILGGETAGQTAGQGIC